MSKEKMRLSRRLLLALGATAVLGLVGCSSVKIVPVSGTVTVDGKPLTDVGVMFTPDASKGNALHVGCWSRLNKQGGFQLATMGVRGNDPHGPGAPVGWYKVSFMDNLPGMPPMPKSVPAKYLDENKTPLEIEVVENPAPGAYDIKVTK